MTTPDHAPSVASSPATITPAFMPNTRALQHSRIAISLLFFANGAAFGSWVTRIADKQAALGLGSAALGGALLAIAVGAMCAMPLVGLLTRWLGVVWVTALASLACAAVLVLPGWAYSFETLLVALVLFGACSGTMDVAMNACAAQVEKSYGRAIMPAFHGFFSVGGAVGALTGGLFASALIEPRMHLMVVAALLLALTAVAVAFLVVPEHAANTANAAPKERGHANQAVVILGIIAAAVMVGEGAMADWSAVYMKSVLAASPATTALAYAAFSTTMALGRLGGNGVVQRLGELRTVRYGTLTAALGVLLVVTAWHPWVAIAGFGLTGVGYACIFPCVVSASSRIVGMSASTAIGLVTTLGYGGFLLGPPVIGALGEWISLRIALSLVAVLALVSALIAHHMPRR
jgi:MFS family permease